ncbi:MAG: OmpA family protein [Nitrospira sp.]|jgi:chemotaxis protein MotB|nr:OmpA family protein [Nitrospira sp.]MDI3465119.1 Flagellar motor rotation protein MotB [Nitrospira sp.]
MIMKLIAFAFLFTVAVNGHESSLAASQPRVDTQLTEGRSDNGQSSLIAMLVGFLRPADVRHHQRDNEVGSYLHTVDNDDQSPAASATPITPMTSITIDPPQGQLVEADKEKERLEQLLQQLNFKEQELALLREKTSVTTSLLSIEKNRAEALEAQLTQKEQELAGLCTQRDTHQQLSQELNRTKSNLELAKQQVTDIERQFAISNDQLDTAMQRIADLDLQMVAKDQEFQLAKANMDMELASRDSQLVQAKRLLASLGKSLPKPAKLVASNKNPLPQQAITTARATGDLAKANEKLMSALQNELKRGSVALEQRGDKLTLALSGELFAKGRATMTPAGTSLVKRIGVALRKFHPQSVEVAGHTDSTPVKVSNRRPFKDNTELSRARAEHAGKALIKGGLGADRVKAVGYADSQPIATNDTEEGRSKNRRVEIVVTQGSDPFASAVGGKDEQGASSTRSASASYGRMVQKVANH